MLFPFTPESLCQVLYPARLMVVKILTQSPAGTAYFWVKSALGISMNRTFGYVYTGTRGLALITAVTSAIRVESMSCVRAEDPSC